LRDGAAESEFLAWLEEELRDPKEGRTITEVKNIHMYTYTYMNIWMYFCVIFSLERGRVEAS
jgi:hypothetical protein